MAQQSTLENILEAVSGDNSLREALLSRLVPGMAENSDFRSQHVSSDSPPFQSRQYFPAFGTQMYQTGSLHTPLVTQMCQSGRVTPLDTQRCQLGSASAPLVTQGCQLGESGALNPLVTPSCQTGIGDVDDQASRPEEVVSTCENTQSSEDNQGGHQLNECNQISNIEPCTSRATTVTVANSDPSTSRATTEAIVNFDPESITADDEYTFEAQAVINQYLEKHLRRTLDKDTRTQMHKTHPVPKTPATAKPPQVDKFIKDHLAARFPSREDGELSRVQSALLKTSGPIACLWSELIENGMLEDPNASVNVLDVLDIMQRTIVLLGNANELLSQVRRSNLLQIADSALAKYGQDPQPEAGEFLFGPGFAAKLKDQVETDSSLTKIVRSLPSRSHRFSPYVHKQRFSSTISRTRQQFFRGSPAGNRGTRQGGARTSQYRGQPRGRGTSHSRHCYQSPVHGSRRS